AYKPTLKARPRLFVRRYRIGGSPHHDPLRQRPKRSALSFAVLETMSRGCSRQFVREHPVGDIVALALGHDGLRILADWILADRSLANRRRRRRRLLTRQVGGGGSAQHGQGCSRSEYNDLHHDYSPCVWTASPSGSPEDRATEEGRPPLPITT